MIRNAELFRTYWGVTFLPTDALQSMSIALSEKLKSEGNELFGLGNFQLALSKYTEAVKLNGENPVLYSNRAATYLNLKEWEKAILDCNAGLKLIVDEKDNEFQSVNIKLLCRKAVALRNCGDIDAALKCIDDALFLDPENSALKKESQIIRGIHKKSKYNYNTGNVNDSRLRQIKIQEVDEIPSTFFTQQSKGDNRFTAVSHKSVSIKAKKIEDVQNDDYPTHPTVQFLSSLKAQPKSKLPSYYEYVLNITPQQYSLIYKVTGLEPEFLNFFLEACTHVLQDDKVQYKAQILTLLSLFASLPRFSLTSMFADSAKVEKLRFLFTCKLNEDFNNFWP